MPQYEEAIARLQSALDRHLGGRQNIHVLEAGCGSTSQITIAPDAHVTGIDISEKQLERNMLLDEKILGDIQDYALPEERYDVIVCWDVLEHLPRPERALANIVRTARTGGLVLLGFPNIWSAKGLLTKCTSFRFHVWVRRTFFGEKDAGTNDFGPFPTFMKFSIAPAAIRKRAQASGLEVVFWCLYESRMHRDFRERHPVLNAAWFAVSLLAQTLSVGKLSALRTDCLILLRKHGELGGTMD